MKSLLCILGLTALLSQSTIALTTNHPSKPLLAPQPTPCVTSTFSSTGDRWWKSITLKLTNNCGKAIDLQNASATFLNGIELNTNMWGTFTPLPYPDNDLRITSQRTDGNFLATFNLHFPTVTGSTTQLGAGKSIFINYGAASEAHIGNANVYLGAPVATGTIQLTNVTSKPANVSQTYALVHLTSNGQKISDIQLPWNSIQNLGGLAAGSYTLAADNVSDTNGNTYEASVSPAIINLAADQIVRSTVSYTLVQQTGKIAIHLQALPSELAGYLDKPSAVITQSGTGSSVTSSLNWNQSTIISQLKNGGAYTFATNAINYNNYQCQPTFNPATLVASATPPVTELSYACTPVAQNTVTLNVTGAPATLSTLKITLTPNNNTSAITQSISLANGSGTSTVQLPNGVIYQVSADDVAGYSISFNPQPLVSTNNAVETITLTAGNTPVSINGQLTVCGTKLCNQYGNPIQLKGMSTHGLQWYGWNVCITPASLDALAKNFGASVIRVSLYVQEGGYESDPAGFTAQVNQIIAEATKRGLYVIVDWHILTPGDPNYNLERAKKFFTDIANANQDKVNLLYEIANEPNGVTWSTIKSYAEKLIPVIRAIDKRTPILIGTPDWSSLGISGSTNSSEIINNPVNATNIMYTFHFYAVSHRDEYLNELDKASNSLPMFVTEFGTQNYEGDGVNDFVMGDKYIQLMANKQIGWTNWNFSDDFRSGAIWKEGTCSSGTWTDSNLKESGTWVKSKMK